MGFFFAKKGEENSNSAQTTSPSLWPNTLKIVAKCVLFLMCCVVRPVLLDCRNASCSEKLFLIVFLMVV